MRVPSEKMAPTLRWYPQACPTHAFYSDEGKKCQLGDKKAKRRSEFRRDSLHVFSQDHCLTVEEEVFEQSSLDIYNFWGNSVWFAKIQAGPFWFGHFVTVWQLYLFCYDDNKNSKYSLLLLVLLLCRRRMLLLGLRDPSFPYKHSQTAWWKVAAWGRATGGGVPEMQASLS